MTAHTMSRPEKLVAGLMAIQVILPLSVMLLHPGFDKKNGLGLDFDFVVAMVVAAGFAWIAGLIFALQLEARKRRYLIGHLVTLVFGALYFALV